MKSPFPGMDPYLERHWRDVHQRLCVYACDALQTQIRPGLLARIDERLIVETGEGAAPRSIYPDVRVFERHSKRPAGSDPGGVAVAEPLLIKIGNEKATEGFIRIIDPASGGTLVTVIEFLSTANKQAHGREQYLKKQEEIESAEVSLVEIDLLRAGGWVLQVPIYHVPPDYHMPYRACVRRGWKWDEFEFYHLPFEQRLPKISIPLRENDADAFLDLQALIDQVYRSGGYDEIDYSVPPIPPLEGASADWARDVISKRGGQTNGNE
jgi:hypothetical protein